MKKINAILTSDWHLREDTPISRIDDFWKAQWNKVKVISELQKAYGCIVIHAGDLFHNWKPSPFLLSYTMQRLPDKFYTLYGNHDLPQHNLTLKNKTGIYALETAKKLHVFDTCHWDKEPDEPSIVIEGKEILVWHYFAYQIGTKENYMTEIGKSSNMLLRKYKQFDLIVTGDNHQSFVEQLNNRLLVNPGSITRQSASQIGFQPKVYLYSAAINSVEVVKLPIKTDVWNIEHLTELKDKDKRIQAFIESLSQEWDSTINFQDNLRLFFEKNNTSNEVKEYVLKTLEQ